jgi:hypothetical protein
MTTPPPFNGRVIGQAERATRAVLEELLVPHGVDFTSWVTVNLLATSGGHLPEADLTGLLTAGLRIPASAATEAVDATVAAGLTERSAEPAVLGLTAAGAEAHALVLADVDALTDRLYGDLPPDDLATAGRVLALITERATAVLAG